jgi:hypothetical protein
MSKSRSARRVSFLNVGDARHGLVHPRLMADPMSIESSSARITKTRSVLERMSRMSTQGFVLVLENQPVTVTAASNPLR